VHLGLTPQSVNIFGGFKVQGRDTNSVNELREAAIVLEKAGALMLLLECIPNVLAKEISQSVQIPVVGIGAGANTDAQVLVLHDMLGLSGRVPKFVRNFMEGESSIYGAISSYVKSVKQKNFPGDEHAYE
jgi:3-methyl-2-oxobutanoate hydroxymethyltransferase